MCHIICASQMNCLHVISIPKWILLKQGLLPSRSKRKLRIFKMILHCTIYTIALSILLLNVIKGIRQNNPIFVNRMMCIVIPMLNILAKLLGILKNEKDYLSILDILKSDIFNTSDKQLSRHILLVQKISGLMSRYFTVTIGVLFLVAGVLPVITKIEPLMPCPIDIGQYSIFYNIIHLPFTFYFAINSPGFDLLLMSLLGIGIGQLNILEERLIRLDEPSDRNVNEISRKVEKALRECLDLHKMINEYVENMTTLLSLPLFFQYVCGCFIICNAVLQLTIMGGKTTIDVIFIGTYTCVTFSQMAVYHWLGNEIMHKSCKLIDACYLSKWYRLEWKSQKCLLLLMERAQKPLAIKLYTIVYISLESLAAVIRWSYSLFAIMKATYN